MTFNFTTQMTLHHFLPMIYNKRALTKHFHCPCIFRPLRGWGVGLGESVKKGKFVTKIFFYIDNFESSSEKL